MKNIILLIMPKEKSGNVYDVWVFTIHPKGDMNVCKKPHYNCRYLVPKVTYVNLVVGLEKTRESGLSHEHLQHEYIDNIPWKSI